jgi:predicted nucleotidyltransferase component of viral defense system
MPHPLEALLHYASETAGNDRQVASVIVKELLHYEILYALSETTLADKLVFQGGTALRLCYGGNRYSEDLDFVSADTLEPDEWQQFERILKRTVAKNFGCDLELQAPKRGGGDHVAVDRWQARVYLPPEIALQARTERINIEVAHIPAWEATFRFVGNNYPLQVTKVGYGGILLQVESLREILADKVVALAGRPYLKARDIWDVNWLLQKDIEVDPKMVVEKANYYGIGRIDEAMDGAVEKLHDAKAPQRFRQEMSRFLLSAGARRLSSDAFVNQFFDTVENLLMQVKKTCAEF